MYGVAFPRCTGRGCADGHTLNRVLWDRSIRVNMRYLEVRVAAWGVCIYKDHADALYPDRQQYLVWPQLSKQRQNYKMSDTLFQLLWLLVQKSQNTENELPKANSADAPADTLKMDRGASGTSECQSDYRCTCRGNCGFEFYPRGRGGEWVSIDPLTGSILNLHNRVRSSRKPTQYNPQRFEKDRPGLVWPKLVPPLSRGN